MSLFVIRNLIRKLRDKVWAFRSRTNETHLTAQNIPKLRYLIDSNLANDAPNARGSIVTFACPYRSRFFSVNSHGAKLHQNKCMTVLAHSFLLIENRAF